MKNKLKIPLSFKNLFKKSVEKEKMSREQKMRLLVSAILFVLVSSVSILALAKERDLKQAAAIQQQNTGAKIVLYYSEQCPHCKNVEKYIEDNGIREIVTFDRKEVRVDRNNANEMKQKAVLCNIPVKELGIPFLWDGENGNKCLMGDQDIINFFKSKVETQKKTETVNTAATNKIDSATQQTSAPAQPQSQPKAVSSPARPEEKVILYYSEQCPHCQNVEKYIEENNVEKKFSFSQKEISTDKNNSKEMDDKAKLCNMDIANLGIPFLWDGENGNKCLMGDKDIINYFKNKINA